MGSAVIASDLVPFMFAVVLLLRFMSVIILCRLPQVQNFMSSTEAWIKNHTDI